MAIIPANEYPGKISPGDSEYPQGKARNVTVQDDGTGTPWEANLVNDVWGLLQRLLSDAGITPSGVPDTILVSDYKDALDALFVSKSLGPEFSAQTTFIQSSTTGLIVNALPLSIGNLISGDRIEVVCQLRNSQHGASDVQISLNVLRLVGTAVIAFTHASPDLINSGTSLDGQVYSTCFSGIGKILATGSLTLTVNIAISSNDLFQIAVGDLQLYCRVLKK